MLADILESAPVTGEVDGEQAVGLLLAVDDKPTTFDVARGDEEWCKAMLEELSSIKQNDTWTLVDLPRGHHAIRLK
jgi:hypothetical protein